MAELKKFHADRVETEQHRWLKFLNEGERLDADDLPPWMRTNEMRQAMSTLKAFSEKERAYHAYQARQNFLRQQRSIERELEAAAQSVSAAHEREQAAHEREKAALQREEAERKSKEAALAEIERLKAQLRDQ